MGRFSFQPALQLKGRRFRWLSGFEGKPFHPPLTDVTVGAYVIGPIFGLIAFFFPESAWSARLFEAGGWVILAGAITSVATALTGFADWLRTEKGSQVRRVANAHAITMIGLTVVVVVNLAYRYLPDGGNNATDPSTVSLALDLAILGLVALGGTIGGSLTYDWGVSVETAGDHPAHPAGEPDYDQPKDAP